MPLLKILDRVTAKVIGNADAGACIDAYHCCCQSGTTRALNCYGNCIASTSCFKAGSGHPNC